MSKLEQTENFGLLSTFRINFNGFILDFNSAIALTDRNASEMHQKVLLILVAFMSSSKNYYFVLVEL